MEFNEKLQQLRKRKGLTQEELAHAVQYDFGFFDYYEYGVIIVENTNRIVIYHFRQ